MLEAVRRYAQSGFFSYVLIAGLIVIFMFFFGVPTQWCGGQRGQRTPDLLAEVDGKEIYTSDLSILYNNPIYSNFLERKQRKQPNADSNMEDPSVQSKALRTILLVELFAKKARDAGLRVGEKEFRSFMKDPMRNFDYRLVYGRDGQWEGGTYKRYIQHKLLLKPKVYEAYKRKELLARKYLSLMEMQIGVLPKEIEDLHNVKNTEVNLSFVEINPGSLKNFVKVSTADIDDYLEQNQEDVKKYYDNNKSEFERPERVRLRRIFISRPTDDSGDERKKAKQKFEKVKAQLDKEDQTFGKVAGEMSEGTMKKSNGLMDWSPVDNIQDKNIAEAIKGADVGTVKEVKTDYAYMLVKVENRQDAQKTKFEDAKRDIATKLYKEEKAKNLAEKVSTEFLSHAKESKNLEKAVKSFESEHVPKSFVQNLSLEDTGRFTRETQSPNIPGGNPLARLSAGGPSWTKIPSIGSDQKLKVDAFKRLSSDQRLGDKAYKVNDSYYIVWLKERTEPKKKELKENRTKWRDERQSKKVKALLGQWNQLFVIPSAKPGPWIEAQYKKAIESGFIKLYKEKHDAAKMAAPGYSQKPSSPLGGAGGKSPIKLKTGSKSKGSK